MAATIALVATQGCRARKGLLPRGDGQAVVLISPDAAATPGSLGDIPGATEREPNNSKAQAERVFLAPWPLDPGAPLGDPSQAASPVAAWSVAGQVSSPTDVDTYQLVLVPPAGLPVGAGGSLDAGADGGINFEPGSFARLSVSLVFDTAGSLPEGLLLEIRSSNDVRILQQTTGVDGVQLPNIGLVAGSDLLLIVSRVKRKTSTSAKDVAPQQVSYRLTVGSFAAQAGEEAEPNSDPTQATQVPSATATVEAVGYLGWKQDTDWFAFSFPSMPPDSVLSIELDLPPDGSGTLNVAYDGAVKALHGYSRASVGKLQLKGIAVPSNGPLFVRVQNTGPPILTQKYRLTISAVNLAEGDESEPNGRLDHAFETSAARINGFVHPAGDIDIFKLCGRAALPLSVESPAHLDLEVSLVDAEGANVSTATALGGRTTVLPPIPTGDCTFIQIREKSGKMSNLLEVYSLRMGS